MIRITRLLCPVDFSDIAQHAVDHAAAIAGWYDARLTLLYVFATRPTMDLPPLVLSDTDRAAMLSALKTMASRVPAGVDVEYLVQEAPSIHDEIVARAGASGADLLVLGTHGRSGYARLFLGSVTERVIRSAPCPTLVVPPRAPDVAPDAPIRFTRILCAVDFYDSSLRATEYALALAQEADACLTLLHVIDIPPELKATTHGEAIDVARIRREADADARRRLHELVPADAGTYCTVRTDVIDGGAYRQIGARAAFERANLIVMGVHGRHGLVDRLLFGSTTHHVLRTAPCPVLVVR